jgi:hypothetical protein
MGGHARVAVHVSIWMRHRSWSVWTQHAASLRFRTFEHWASMTIPPTNPTGCLGALARLGDLIAAGALLIIFGGVGALSGAASGLLSGAPNIGATLLSMLCGAGAGMLLGSLSGILTASVANRNDAAARRQGRRAGDWNETIVFGTLLLTGALCGSIGAALAATLFAGSITIGLGAICGGIVALVSIAVLWGQLQGSG